VADLPKTLSFKATVAMDVWIRELARNERRKVGDMIRILLEQQMAYREQQREMEDHRG
jgi:hypothetical protein